MKAVVLAGGYATRLWPVTKHRPKMLLPVGNTTVIDRIFEALEADDRIESVYVSTNERFASAFETHLADSDFEKPTLSVEETTDEDEKFGVVGALAQLIDREGLEDDLLIIAGELQVVAVEHAQGPRRALQHLQAVRREVEVGHDLRVQQADGVGIDGVAKARVELFGQRCAADAVPGLQYQHPAAGGSEVGGTDQAVVPATDDDDIHALCHGSLPPCR